MTSTDAEHVIPVFRKWFTDTAAPDILFPDQGPPFTAQSFKNFLTKWGVGSGYSSACYPQGNSNAELAAKNIKRLIEKYYKGPQTNYDDFAQGLLQVRNTPVKSTGMSPAQMLYGRPTQDTLPAHKSHFTRDWHEELYKADVKFAETCERSESYYNRGTANLPAIQVGSPVVVQNHKTGKWDRVGVVLDKNSRLRRYLIRLSSGMIINRNRRHVKIRKGKIMPPIYTIGDGISDVVAESVNSSHAQFQRDSDSSNATTTKTVQNPNTSLNDNVRIGNDDVRIGNNNIPTVRRYNRPCKF